MTHKFFVSDDATTSKKQVGERERSDPVGEKLFSDALATISESIIIARRSLLFSLIRKKHQENLRVHKNILKSSINSNHLTLYVWYSLIAQHMVIYRGGSLFLASDKEVK